MAWDDTKVDSSDVLYASDYNTLVTNVKAKVAHSLATAANDFLVASGPGTFVKKTLAEVITLLAHASTHASGAADAIRLDDLAAPDDNTDLDVSASRHGLCPKLPGTTTTFLRGDGTYASPSGSGGGITWTEVTGTSQTAAADNGYIPNNVALVTITLPSTCAVGKIIRVSGLGAGGWKIAQNASQYIRFGRSVSTTGTGGYIQSTDQYDSIELLCKVTDIGFKVISHEGVIEVI